jgi:hypothetical protein
VKKTNPRRPIHLPVILALAFALAVPPVASAAAPRITKEELKGLLDKGDVLLVDDRSGRDWISSEYKIEGAVRVPPGEEVEWAANIPKNKTIVFYCA